MKREKRNILIYYTQQNSNLTTISNVLASSDGEFSHCESSHFHVDVGAVDDGASEPVSSALRPITSSSEVLVSTHVAKDTSTSDDEVIDLNR